MVENEPFTQAQRRSLDERQGEQDRTLAAMHRLEAALESAGPGREDTWRVDVLTALIVLHEASLQASASSEQPASLMSDIARSQPRLRNRVRGIRAQYRQLMDATQMMMRELQDDRDSIVDVGDLRQRLTWVLSAMRHARARESDLIYEAYYDAFKTDLADDRVIGQGGF
jgi:hypothetical protein